MCRTSKAWRASCLSAPVRCSAGWVRFTSLLDEARREMAQRYLSAGRASLTEIAYLLGFAEPNSFFRSFKRWTGETPAEFRQARGIEPTAPPRLRGP